MRNKCFIPHLYCLASILLSPSYADIFKAHRAHIIRFVDVTKVGNFRRFQKFFHFFHIQRSKLIPFGNDNQNIRVLNRIILVGRILDVGKQMLGFFHRHRIESLDFRAACL